MFQSFYATYGAFLRFCLSGGTAAVVLFGLLYTLTDIFGVWYLISSILSSAAAFIVSFTLHKFWTFSDPHLGRASQQVASHLATGLVNMGLSALLLYILVEYAQVHYLVGQLLVTATLALVSFFIYKHFIFHRGRYGATPEQL